MIKLAHRRERLLTHYTRYLKGRRLGIANIMFKLGTDNLVYFLAEFMTLGSQKGWVGPGRA